jgi:hypothetical protein
MDTYKIMRDNKCKIDEAADFMTDLLSDGSIPAIDAVELADEAGISKRTLLRVKEAVNAISKRVDGHWIWYL